MPNLLHRLNISSINALLIDIHGVLFNTSPSGPIAIENSVHAFNKLKKSRIPLRLCSNESQISGEVVLKKLLDLGFNASIDDIFNPPKAVKSALLSRNLRPLLLIHSDLQAFFADIEQTDCNCVVLGDTALELTSEKLYAAFNLLIANPNAKFYSMGQGRYYKHGDGLMMDLGGYMKALEYWTGVSAEVIGKPSKAFFQMVVDDLKATTDSCVMIGDDVVSDVGGAQNSGLKGVLVRTGKYRPEDELRNDVKPNLVVNDLNDFVAQLEAQDLL